MGSSGGAQASSYLSSYFSDDTIAAFATGVSGAVAIVRVSGPAARRVRDTLAPEVREWHPRRVERTWLSAPTETASHEAARERIDNALVTWFEAPRSLTGEDVIEFAIHGGALHCERVLRAVLSLSRPGFAGVIRQARPGEFSFRAVRAGKLSVAKAQAVADLIAAETSAGHALALERLQGLQERSLAELAEGLRQTLTLAEAGIDFSDQDIDAVSLPSLRRRLGRAVEQLARLSGDAGRGRVLQEGVEIAIVGVPNAGKSSLFNALLGEARAIVSEQAGTTRDLIRERIELETGSGRVRARLADTAGLRTLTSPDSASGAHPDAIEAAGIALTERALERVSAHGVVVWVISGESAPADAGRGSEEVRVGRSVARARECVVVLSKVDGVRAAEPERTRRREHAGALVRAASVAGEGRQSSTSPRSSDTTAVLEASAESGLGLSELRAALASAAARLTARAPGEFMVTREEQRQALEAGQRALARALEAPSHELLSAELRIGLSELAPLIGGTTSEDVLGRIFSSFCIGK